jgi:glutathione S-transferase
MIKIYHVTGTRGVRPIWACEELGLPYEVETIDFSAEYRSSPEWRALSPTGKVPVMTDGDLVMLESGAMVQYLLDRYGEGRLQPTPGTPEHALYLQWSWFAEATFARPLGEVVNHGREFPGDARIPEVVREMQNRGALCVDAVDQVMRDRDYILGAEFSAADIMLGYTLMLANRLLDSGIPESLQPYWQRLSARPAFEAAKNA